MTREAIAAARARGLGVVLVANAAQNLERLAARKGIEAVQVSGGRDAADFAIIEMLEPDDVVVTQDIGLAAMVLGRGAGAIGVRGRIYQLATIDAELLVRHEQAKLRRAGGRHRGPAGFTDEDREHFTEQLEWLLSSRA